MTLNGALLGVPTKYELVHHVSNFRDIWDTRPRESGNGRTRSDCFCLSCPYHGVYSRKLSPVKNMRSRNELSLFPFPKKERAFHPHG